MASLSTSKKATVKAVRNFNQKFHFFKWKLVKYQDASDTYFMERNYPMVDLCDKNVQAYQKALTAAANALGTAKEELKAYVATTD